MSSNGDEQRGATPSVVPGERNDSDAPEQTFPEALWDMIEIETKDGIVTADNGGRVIEWTEEGDAFIVRDKSALESTVLPKYFSNKCKFMSFVRKLYRWGFRQVEKSVSGSTIFVHTSFLRSDKGHCNYMRSVVKKQSAQTVIRSTERNNINGTMPQYGQMMDPYAALMMQQQMGVMNNPMMSMSNQVGFSTISNGSSVPNNSSGSIPPILASLLPKGNVTSMDMFEAGLRLEKVEKEERQNQTQRLMDMLKNHNASDDDISGGISNYRETTSIEAGPQHQMPSSISGGMTSLMQAIGNNHGQQQQSNSFSCTQGISNFQAMNEMNNIPLVMMQEGLNNYPRMMNNMQQVSQNFPTSAGDWESKRDEWPRFAG